MSNIIDGKVVSSAVKQQVANKVAELAKQGISVGLEVILVGEDPASKIYVANKEKACEALGIVSKKYVLPETTTQDELLQLIEKLNCDKEVNGILCQLPLPKGLDEKIVININTTEDSQKSQKKEISIKAWDNSIVIDDKGIVITVSSVMIL